MNPDIDEIIDGLLRAATSKDLKKEIDILKACAYGLNKYIAQLEKLKSHQIKDNSLKNSSTGLK